MVKKTVSRSKKAMTTEGKGEESIGDSKEEKEMKEDEEEGKILSKKGKKDTDTDDDE